MPLTATLPATLLSVAASNLRPQRSNFSHAFAGNLILNPLPLQLYKSQVSFYYFIHFLLLVSTHPTKFKVQSNQADSDISSISDSRNSQVIKALNVRRISTAIPIQR
ncbi:uncharacterized protein LOC131019424 [Salvia miltiorrhiza]|uniref:uncharacterized protein LOC131019424 n=1 Tax=Salvia miltiorrhiza TaxID=226208 RepID=UPI0025AC121E|nr:uncharacterized protein LOC131019424 [Salvia miltiorrhiza]